MKSVAWTILTSFFLLSACQGTGDSQVQGKTDGGAAQPVSSIADTMVGVPKTKPMPPAPPPPLMVSGLDVPAKLNSWMMQVQAAEGNYSNRMQTIKRGQEEHRVMIFSDQEGKVRMVRADITGNAQLGTLEFYLNGGKVVVLREYLPGRRLVENRFYNRQDGQFMECLSRSIGPGEQPDSVAFKPYVSKYGFDDFRLKPSYVQKWMEDYLKNQYPSLLTQPAVQGAPTPARQTQ